MKISLVLVLAWRHRCNQLRRNCDPTVRCKQPEPRCRKWRGNIRLKTIATRVPDQAGCSRQHLIPSLLLGFEKIGEGGPEKGRVQFDARARLACSAIWLNCSAFAFCARCSRRWRPVRALPCF